MDICLTKVYICEYGYDYEGSVICTVFDNEEKAKKWEQFCNNLKDEWTAYCKEWEEINNPSHGYTKKSAWSTDIARNYSDEFKKVGANREADYFQYTEHEVV